MDLMERVKSECGERKSCEGCKLDNCEGQGCMFALDPCHWNIEAIRKALGETSDKASDKEEIVVPKKWSNEEIVEFSCNIGYRVIACILDKQNKIIDCLDSMLNTETAYWDISNGFGRCSACGGEPFSKKGIFVRTPYCPWCGAKMKTDKEEWKNEQDL